MYNWRIKTEVKAQNAIFLEEGGQEGRPFKSRFLQAGLVKYDFGVCLLQKETIDKFINTFIGCPVIINHSDTIRPEDEKGKITRIWFSAEDGWFWCEGIITDEETVRLIEDGYNVSCQYAITEWVANEPYKLHNGNEYDKEILNGVFEHLAIVENPRYEGAFIAVNAYIAKNAICKNEFKENDHPRDEEGKFTDGGNTSSKKYNEEIDKIKSGEYPRGKQITVVDKPSAVWKNAGLQDKKIVLPAAVYLKATQEKHNVDEDTMRNLPQLLEDPPFIFKSSTEPNSFVGVLDAVEKDKDGDKPLIVAVKPVNDHVEVNIITSAYGKDPDFVNRELKKGNLLYRRKKTASNSVVASIATETLKPSDNIITDNSSDYNPNITKYDKAVNFIRNYRKDVTMDAETKNVFSMLIDALKARNEAEEKKDKDCDDNAANKAKNADEDKRKLIDEVAGIMKSAGADDELIRTAIAKMEKIAYDKSEAGTADNKAAKNEEEDKTDKKDDKKAENEGEGNKDDKTDKEAANKAKNEEEEKLYEELKDKVDKAAENKAKNSLNEAVNQLYAALAPEREPYIDGIELGNKIYG